MVWEVTSEGTQHVVFKLFGPFLHLVAFFMRKIKELYPGMLPDVRNAAGTELPFLNWTLATINFDWLH